MADKLISDFTGAFFNGVQISLKQATGTVTMGGFAREPQLGPNRVLGHSRQFVAGGLTITAALPQGTDIRGTFDFEDGQIRLVDDRNGEWLMTGATLANPNEFSAGAGDLAAEYSGDPWVQL